MLSRMASYALSLPQLTLIFYVVILLAHFTSGSSFSIHYAHDENKNHAKVVLPLGDPLVFAKHHPTAEQVADLYARTTGRPPLLKEEHMSLPTSDMLSKAAGELSLSLSHTLSLHASSSKES